MSSDIIAPDKIKDVLITRTAIKLLQSESIVEKVISFQFKDISQMMKVHNQVEVSGFGKFLISRPKLKRRLERYEEILWRTEARLAIEQDEKRKGALEKRVEEARSVVEYLRTRTSGYENKS